MRAQTSWMAAINGKDASAVQSIAYPSDAPVTTASRWSSSGAVMSAAPGTAPGTSYWRIERASVASSNARLIMS